MSSTLDITGKVVFSVIGVICLLLAGNTAVNYARTMETFSEVTVAPEYVTVNKTDRYYVAVVTLLLDNPSQLDIRVMWAEALISFYYGSTEADAIDDYAYQFYTLDDNFVVKAGENREFTLKWFLMLTETDDVSRLESRDPATAMWFVYCKLQFRPVDFEHSEYITSTMGWIREVPG